MSPRSLAGSLLVIGFITLAWGQADATELVTASTCEQVIQPGMKPVSPTDRFRPDSPEIHVVAAIKDARARMVFKGTWVAVDAIQTPNYEIDSTQVQINEDGDATLHFQMSRPTSGWPVGRYRFDLSLDGKPFGQVPFAVVAAAAAGAPVSFNLGPLRRDAERIWTVVVYMDGDNDLEPFALRDIEEMERAMPSKGVEVIVLLDRAKGYSSEEGNWTDARVLRIRPDLQKGIHAEVLATPGELNLGDPRVLQAFLSAVLRTFPARRHALILWNHGGGWSAHATDEDAPGAPGGFDKLTLAELRSALAATLRETQMQQLDLVGFDMCLMAQLEVAFELEGLADVMVGSEASEPGDGWPYEAVLTHFANPNLTAKDVAKGIVRAFDDYYRSRQEELATQSAFDLAYVGDLVRALNAFLAKVEGTLRLTWPALTRAMFYSESYGDLKDLRRGPRALLSVDLGDTVQNLVGVQPALRASAEYQALQNAMQKFVLDRKNSYRFRKSQGVSMYAPFRQDLFNAEYLNTRFAQSARWHETLRQLHMIQARTPSQPRILGIETVRSARQARADEVTQLGQDGFRFRFIGNNLLWAFAFVGGRDESGRQTLVFHKSILTKRVRDEDQLKLQKQERQELLDALSYADGENLVGFPYEATRYLVTNGDAAFPATFDASDVGSFGSGIIRVPALYEHPRVGKRFATLYFNWHWRAVAVVLEVPQRDGSFVNVRIDPEPDADIHLLVEAIPDQGERAYAATGTLKWKNGLSLALDLVPVGEYEVLLTLESLSGLSSTARHRFRVAARDDNLLTGVEKARQEFIPENFIGEWEVLDEREWFQRGRMVPSGGYVTWEPHPRYRGLLRRSLYKPRGTKLFPDQDIVDVMQSIGLPHLRQFVLDEEGRPRPDRGFGTGIVVFDYRDGQYLMISMDLRSGDIGVKVKRSGPTPKLATVPTQPAPAGPAYGPTPGLQGGGPRPGGTPGAPIGAWRAPDGSGIVFQGNQWALYDGGQQRDGGVFVIQGDQLLAESVRTGQRFMYRFAVSGNQLYLQDPSGQVFQYSRVR